MRDEAWIHHMPPADVGEPSLTATLSQPQPTITLCTATETAQPGTMPTLREALDAARRVENPHLVIDLSAISSLGSTEFFTLLEARHHHHLDDRGHLAVVIAPEYHGIPEIYLVALKVSFDLHHTLTNALQACTNTNQ